MAAEINILEKLIADGQIDEAIIFLEKNKEKEPLKNAIKEDNSLLYLTSYRWIEAEGKHIDELALEHLWEMETPRFNSYIQWLPKEVLVGIFELEPIRNLFVLLLNCGAKLDQISSAGHTPLTLAVERANFGLVQFLLGKGANINRQDKDGDTPLHITIECSNLRLAQFLLKNGANINARNRAGNTPLHIAIKYSTWRVAQFLLQNGIDINVQNNSRKSPLHLAVQKDNTEVVAQLLLKDNCNLNAQDKDGKTPLHLAVILFGTDNPRPAELLLASKANVNVQDKDRKAPLHLAVEWGVPSLVQSLLLNGANVNVQDKEGNTPLHLAALNCNRLNYSYSFSERYLEITNSLLSHRAKVTIKNHNGAIPVDCFSMYVPYESLEVIKKVLLQKACLEQKEEQPASSTPAATHSASNSVMSSNSSTFLKGIRCIFPKKSQGKPGVGTSPRLGKKYCI